MIHKWARVVVYRGGRTGGQEKEGQKRVLDFGCCTPVLHSNQMAQQSDSALRAFLALPREPGTLRFFRRGAGYTVYDVYSGDAEAVARGNYGDAQVERLRRVGGEGGPTTLRLSVSLFATVGRFLLRSNAVRIAVYHGPNFSQRWVAGPGNPEPFEAELLAMGSRSKLSDEECSFGGALCVVFGADEEAGCLEPTRVDGVRLGVAAVNVGRRHISLLEIADQVPDLSALEAVAVREDCREILYLAPSSDVGVVAGTPRRAEAEAFQALALRCGVLLSPLDASALPATAGAAQATARRRLGMSTPGPGSGRPPTSLLGQLLGLAGDAPRGAASAAAPCAGSGGAAPGEGSSAAFERSRRLPLARCAAEWALAHLLPAAPPGGGGGGGSGSGEEWSLEVGGEAGLMALDAAAERALLLFPRPAPAPGGGGGGGPLDNIYDRRGVSGTRVARSLLEVLDRTVSTGGARRLAALLRRPSTSGPRLRARLRCVAQLVAAPRCRSAVPARGEEAKQGDKRALVEVEGSGLGVWGWGAGGEGVEKARLARRERGALLLEGSAVECIPRCGSSTLPPLLLP